jgi:hypothetical protein
LVHIAYHPNPNFDLDDANFCLIIEYHKDDSYFVQYCLQKHWTYMVEEGYAPSTRFFGQIVTHANLNRKSLGILWDVILI